MERLDSRVRIVWVVGALIRALFLGGVATVALYFVARDWVWAGPGFGTLVLVLGVVAAILRYRRWRYQLQDDALYIERGVVTHVRTVVPYVRVQHVDSQRSPVERSVGLATVVVYTAGSRQADVSIPGLTPDGAETLQERLRRLAIESEREDAV